jgi:chorismate mutase-like protein
MTTDEQAALQGCPTRLEQLRQQITAGDQQLLSLLAERQRLVRQIGHYKRQHQLPLYDAHREQQLLHRLLAAGQQQQLSAEYMTQLFQVIFRHSLALQQQLSIDSPAVDNHNALPSLS